MKNSPKVSVIVPVFKVEKTLKRCVDSVLRQSYENLEIILVDDGSPDGCPAICDAYGKQDKRVKVVHQQNGGLSSARNTGIGISTGDYINFVDSDDYMHHKAIETLVDIALKYKINLVSSNPLKITNDIEVEDQDFAKTCVKILDRKTALEEMLYSEALDCYAWGKLYKRELFDNVKFPVGKLFEDSGTTYKIIDLCEEIAIINNKIYYYINNAAGITKSSFSNRKMDLLNFTCDIKEFVKQKYPSIVKAADYKIFTVAFFTMMEILVSGGADYHENELETCESAIKNTHLSVLFNKRTNLYEKKIAFLAMFGKKRIRQLFLLKQKLKVKK